jgi:hypothetical protein
MVILILIQTPLQWSFFGIKEIMVDIEKKYSK